MDRTGFRFAFRLLCWEAVFAIAFETWTGPVYLGGVAGELGVPLFLMSLLAAVPWIGSIGQLFAVGLFDRGRSLRGLTLALAGGARLLWIAPVALGWAWGLRAAREGVPFPATRWFALTFLAACASALMASAGGVTWLAWARELAPERFRGRFFGVRQRGTMAAVVAAHGLGYLWVSWKPGGFHAGYGLLLTLALGCAAVSMAVLAHVPDARESLATAAANSDGPTDEIPSPSLRLRLRGFRRTVREPLADPAFRRVIVFGALFNGSIQLAGPYFPYYFTRELHIPMSTISLWTLLTYLGWLLAAVAWGRHCDRARVLGRAFPAALVLCAISPLYYVYGSSAWVSAVGPIDYFTNGIAWGGYQLLLTTIQLRNARPGRCATYLSVYSAVVGASCAAGTLLGAQLAALLVPVGGFRALFLIATLVRLAVLWALRPMLTAAIAHVPEATPATAMDEVTDPAWEPELRPGVAG